MVSRHHDELLCIADQLLSQSVQSARHPFHQAVFATQNMNAIEQRMLVLRRWVMKRRTLMFHTDIRSPKVVQLRQNPQCSILFYSQPDKLQLRFKCQAHIHYQDRLSDYLFSQTTASQRECYRFSAAPSIEIAPSTKEQLFLESGLIHEEDPYRNFSVCVCNFNQLDLLYLSYKGHQRVLYEWAIDGVLTSTNLIA